MDRDTMPGACKAARRFLDSFARNEDEDGVREAYGHIAICPACAREFETGTRVASALRRAVLDQPDSPFLEAKIRTRLREQVRRSAKRWSQFPGSPFLTIAAVLTLSFGIWSAYQRGHFRFTVNSQEAYIRRISARVPPLLRLGLGDHVHCTVFRRFKAQVPTDAEMLEKLGPEYRGLFPIVRGKSPESYKPVMAHRCSYRGRMFVHLALRGESKLLSVIVASKLPGEAFRTADAVTAVSEPGLPIYRARVQRFAVAAFETGAHLVYVVSDLDAEHNTAMLAGMARPIREYLRRREI